MGKDLSIGKLTVRFWPIAAGRLRRKQDIPTSAYRPEADWKITVRLIAAGLLLVVPGLAFADDVSVGAQLDSTGKITITISNAEETLVLRSHQFEWPWLKIRGTDWFGNEIGGHVTHSPHRHGNFEIPPGDSVVFLSPLSDWIRESMLREADCPEVHWSVRLLQSKVNPLCMAAQLPTVTAVESRLKATIEARLGRHLSTKAQGGPRKDHCSEKMV